MNLYGYLDLLIPKMDKNLMDGETASDIPSSKHMYCSK